MFVLQSNITIGPYKRVQPIDVTVNKSMFEYVQRAVIKLPITARIKMVDGTIVSASTETAKQINEGMPVSIELGYNGSLKAEFVGFVSRVNFTSPCEVECEGYSYQLRQRTYLKTFVKAQLLDVLKYLVQGTDITLDEKNIPSFVIEKLVLQKHSGTEALELIKKISENTIRIFFTGKQLYAGLQYTKPLFDVKYRLGWNVIKDNNLKLRQAKNQDFTIHYIGEKKDGTKVSAKAGSTGEEKVKSIHAVTDESSLKQMADAKLKQLSYDGYEGKITAFLQPYCEPGCRNALDDKRYPERSGNYICESIEVTYGLNGARRIVGIGAKL